MNMLEKMARAMCESEYVDPDAIGYGLGTMEANTSYPLWKARLPAVYAALDALMEPTAEMIAAIPENYFSMYSTLDEIRMPEPFWREHLFKIVVQAAKDGK